MSALRICWIIGGLALFSRTALAGNLTVYPERPAAGQDVSLILDEFESGTDGIQWEYKYTGDDQWQTITPDADPPRVKLPRPGAVIVRSKISRNNAGTRILQRLVVVGSAKPKTKAARTAAISASEETTSSPELREPQEFKYGAVDSVSLAILRYRVNDDGQFVEHAKEVAEIYRAAAARFKTDDGGDELTDAAVKDGRLELDANIDKFTDSLDTGSLGAQAWSKFFAMERNLYLTTWRRHEDEMHNGQNQAAYLEEVAHGIDFERERAEKHTENSHIYQSYNHSDLGSTPTFEPFDPPGRSCLSILFGH